MNKLIRLSNLTLNSNITSKVPFQGQIGFTLAEVLITLGIIGIVAALTMPTIINNSQNKENESRLKTAYSLVQNAVTYLHSQDIIISDGNNDTGNGADLASGHKSFVSVFAKAFDTVNKNSDDFSQYAPPPGVATSYKTMANGTFSCGLLDDGYFELKNGMAILIEAFVQVSPYPIIFVDLNGSRKKPNKMGYDTFAFVIDKNDKVCPLGSPECTGRPELLDYEKYCSKTEATYHMSNVAGITCAYKAFVDENYFKTLK